MHSIKKQFKALKNRTLSCLTYLSLKFLPVPIPWYLVKNIASSYGIPLGNVITSTYSDGEFQPSFEESIRGTRVFIIGSTNPGSMTI